MNRLFIMRFSFAVLMFLLLSCASATPTPSPTATPTLSPTATYTPIPSATTTAMSAPTVTPTPVPTNHPGWLPEGAVARFGKGMFHSMAASTDGSMIAIAAAGGIYIVESPSGRIVNFLESGADAVAVSFSPDGEKVFIGLSDIGVQVWNRTQQNSWKKNDVFFPSCADRILVSPDGSQLVTYCFKRLVVWDIDSQKILYQQNMKLTRRSPTPFGMDFSPNDPNLVAIAANRSVTFIEATSGTIKGVYYSPKSEFIHDVKFSPDGSIVAFISDSSAITLVEMATLSVVGTIEHESKILSLSFVGNDAIFSVNDGEYILQQIDGTVVKQAKMQADSSHAIMSNSNIVALKTETNVLLVSLDNLKTVGKISGFVYTNWKTVNYSGDGNAFVGTWYSTDYFFGDFKSPDDFKYLNANEICHGGRWVSFFGNSSKYFLITCEDSLKVMEIATKRIVFSKPLPVRNETNAKLYHPWSDERELLAMTYEGRPGSDTKYYIEIWEPLDNKKISVIDLEIKNDVPWMIFSPQSKLLAVTSKDNSNIYIYDILDGRLMQTISGIQPGVKRYWISDSNRALIFQRENRIDVYSIESGELLYRTTGLCSGDSSFRIPAQGMEFFDEVGTLVWYCFKYVNAKWVAYFDYYELSSGEPISNYSIEIPISGNNPYYDDGNNYRSGITDVLFHPEGNGNTVVITAVTADLLKWKHNYIFVIDISGNEILKTYSYIGSEWFLPDQTPIINNFMFQRNFDTIFKWDVSVGE